jgi:hypothetical protein
VPGRVGGEISRTVLTPGHDTTTVWDHRAGDRDYVVKAACSATGTTTLTYLLLDARVSSESESQEERTLASGDVPCDGTVTANSAGPLIHGPVTVTFLALPEPAPEAYAVVVPE